MSYEGYEQILCKNGHYDSEDAHCRYQAEWKCPTCGEEAVWSNSVNCTNGSFDYDEQGNKIRIDGYVELELIQPPPFCKCHCGFIHAAGQAVYKIPSKHICDKAPDSVCHFETDKDRDGVPCVVLNDHTMDHNFPRANWHSQCGVHANCLYCGKYKKE